ncbi:MAG: putative sugar phosphate permease, partial [Francisellaceae bacterium]|nr:putative sugar phosphate permease [Francisellaceae bacterium]
MGFLTAVGDLLKPVPYIEGIKDPKLVSKEYKYWRIRIFYSMYIGYVFFYFSRKSFTFAMPALMNDLGFSTKQLGLLNTVLYITYGISKFTSGPLSDKSNPRYFMSIGLICTGIVNLLFGLTSTLWVFI